jgi:putative selenate reductase
VGGDVVRGPATIIEACADGRRVAEAICAEFGIAFAPLPSRPATLSANDIRQVKRMRARKEAQHRPAMLPPAQRAGFDLIEQTLTEDIACREAARCMQCSTFCDKCVEVCPNRANFTYFVSPVHLTLPLLACQNGRLVVAGQESFQVEQARQIMHIDDFCNECGNCATFCVHNGKPYLEKPRLFLQESDFRLEDDNALYIEQDIIRRRERGRESQLSIKDGIITYENAPVRISLSPDFVIREMTLEETFEGMLSLKEAAEMVLILKGAAASLPFLINRGELFPQLR